MKKRIQKIWSTLSRDIFVGERLERNLQNIGFTAVVVMVMGIVMTVLNVLQKQYATSLSPLVMFVAGLISFIAVRKFKKRNVAIAATMIALIIVLTFDVMYVDNGFAFLWSLTVPLAVSYMFSAKMGLFISLYFEMLFIAVFYTPLRALVTGHYTDTVMDRFPLLYFFLSVLTVFVMYQYQKSVIAELEQTSRLSSEIEKQTRFANERADKLERMSDEMAEALAKTIDAKDTYTNGHSIRVSRYSCALARKLGWSAEEVNDLEREAMLHDIGKIGVPEEILRKPGNLSEEEFEVVKSHTTTGGDILTGIEDMEGSAAVARHHHERFDGTGYPSGLSGDAIPLHARIVTIADAYDAMRSDRVYRGGLSRENIRRELVAGSGNQFDPDLLDAFLELFDSGELDEADDI